MSRLFLTLPQYFLFSISRTRVAWSAKRAVVLVCKLAHSLDEFSLIQLFISVNVILLEEIFKFGPESLRLFDSEK